jgi:site-specific DNA-methyltransferase (cytosine-N4-specific)
VTHVWWLTPEINTDSAVEEGEHPHPEANNQRVLQEYSDAHKDLLETGECNGGKRSSGWTIDSESFANENEGSIPDNFIEGHETQPVMEMLDGVSAEAFVDWITGSNELETLSAADICRRLGMGERTPDNVIEASNTASNTHYLQMCREFDVDAHPARFPRQIPEFFIDFLTPNPPYDDWDRGYLDTPIVLDIFSGSNLTGAIAEQKGRYWLAFEKQAKYISSSEFRFRTEEQIRKEINDEKSDFGNFPEIGD